MDTQAYTVILPYVRMMTPVSSSHVFMAKPAILVVEISRLPCYMTKAILPIPTNPSKFRFQACMHRTPYGTRLRNANGHFFHSQ